MPRLPSVLFSGIQRTMRRTLLMLGALGLLAFAALPASQTAAAPAMPTLASNRAALALLDLMNQARAAYGLPPLQLQSGVETVADVRALDMAAHGYFAHVNASGIGAQQLLDAYGVPYHLLGENIARTTEPTDYPLDVLVPAVHQALMNSPHHRENVLETRFQHVGIAVAEIDREYYFAIVFTD